VRIFGQLNRSKKVEPEPYRAFVIGSDGLAIAVHLVVADCDGIALEKAMQLQGALPIELWHGSRKAGDVPATPQQNDASTGT
jgi:hypothetical protein